MSELVAILDGPKATAWVYDFGSHLQVQFQIPGTLGVDGRLTEFPLSRPFTRVELADALRRTARVI